MKKVLLSALFVSVLISSPGQETKDALKFNHDVGHLDEPALSPKKDIYQGQSYPKSYDIADFHQKGNTSIEEKRQYLQMIKTSQNRNGRKNSDSKNTVLDGNSNHRARIDSIVGYKYLPGGDSVYSTLSEYGYDAQGRSISAKFYNYDLENSAWIPEYAYLREDSDEDYTEQGFVWWNTITYYQLDRATGGWIEDYRLTDDVDINGNLLLDILQVFDLEKKQWFTLRQEEMTYDEEGREKAGVFYQHDPGLQDLVGVRKHEIARNEAGLAIEITRYMYDIESSKWFISERVEISYQNEMRSSMTVFGRSNATDPMVEYKADSTFYDNQERIVKEISYDWDSNSNILAPYSKTVYVFGSGEFNKKASYYNFDNQAHKWVYYSGIGFIVVNDITTNTTTTTEYDIDDNGQILSPVRKYEETYNDQDLLILHNVYDDYENQVWNGRYQAVYDYNQSGEYTFQEHKVWDSNKMEWFTTRLITSTEEGNTLIYKTYREDFQTGGYLGDVWRVNTYNNAGQLLTYTSYRWDRNTGEWMNYAYRKITYDQHGREVKKEEHNWDQEKSEWWAFRVTNTFYNDLGEVGFAEILIKDDNSGEFSLMNRNFFYYHMHSVYDYGDVNVEEILDLTITDTGIVLTIPPAVFSGMDPDSIVSFIVVLSNGDPLPDWIEFDLETLSFVIQPESLKSADKDSLMTIVLTFYDSNNNGTSFIFSVNEELRSASTTGIVDSGKHENAELLLYPNPASDLLHLEFQEENSNSFDMVRIIDVTGRVIMQQYMYGNHGPHRIDVSELPNGIYTLIVSDSDSREIRSSGFIISPVR